MKLENGKKLVCTRDYASSFFDLVGKCSHAKSGDKCLIDHFDKAYVTLENLNTDKKFYMPICVLEQYFEEVK